MPSAWLRERRRDYYYRKAKKDKYRSRASYKLLEAIRKYHFLTERDVVIDLGAAPGGWLQVAQKTVGSHGFVLGVDLNDIQPFEEANVCIIVGDITQPGIVKQIKEVLPCLADAVISDVSPKVSGIWEVDHARQVDLARSSLAIATELLRIGGNFFVKVFQGDLFDAFIKEVKGCFSRVKIMKPKASRTKSAEIFVLGRSMKEKR